MVNLSKCDKCGNRNTMCFLCNDNKHYRETKYSHDRVIRNNTINEFIRALNNCDRYTAEQITHCLSGNAYPKNEVFVVDDVYEITEQMMKEV